jgi:hypothetical protein
MKFSSISSSSLIYATLAILAYTQSISFTVENAPSLSTCPREAEFRACELAKVDEIDKCTSGDSIDATSACFCFAYSSLIKNCGKLCPEAMQEYESSGGLEDVKKDCPFIDNTVLALTSIKSSGSRVLLSSVVFLAVLML